MDTILLYLAKVAVIQLVMVVVYNCLFRNDTFYTALRWYFIAGIAASFILPLVNYSAFINPSEQGGATGMALQQYMLTISTVPQAPWWQTYSLSNIIIVLWAATGLYFLWQTCKQFICIRKIQHTKKEHYNSYTIKHIQLPVRPFSFGRSVYINTNLHTSEQINEIIRHELVHIQQFHTLDIVVSVLNKCLFWWNPASWYLSKAIRNNLEYIVDEQMLKQGTDRKQYQYHLLQISQLAYSNSFTNNFNLFNLKTRIKMMNKQKTKPIHLAKWVLLLPVAAVLSVLIGTNSSFADDKKGGKSELKVKTIDVQSSDKKSGLKVNVIDVQNSDGVLPYILIDGKESTMDVMKAIAPEKIDHVEVFKGQEAINKYGDKGKDGVISISLKSGNSTEPNAKKTVKQTITVSSVDKGIDVKGFSGDEGIAIIIDGKESTMDEMKAMDPKTIDRIEILKEKDSEGLSEHKAARKTIVVSSAKKGVDVKTLGLDDKVTIIIDGKKASLEELKALNPDKIESINVTKNGENKVEVTTKK